MTSFNIWLINCKFFFIWYHFLSLKNTIKLIVFNWNLRQEINDKKINEKFNYWLFFVLYELVKKKKGCKEIINFRKLLRDCVGIEFPVSEIIWQSETRISVFSFGKRNEHVLASFSCCRQRELGLNTVDIDVYTRFRRHASIVHEWNAQHRAGG